MLRFKSSKHLNGNYVSSAPDGGGALLVLQGVTTIYQKGSLRKKRKITSWQRSPRSHRIPNMAQQRIKRAFNVDLPQHKRAQITAEADGELQVIGAGLPRTGTTSLKAAMEILGFDPCHHMSVSFWSELSLETTTRSYIHFPTGAPRPSQKESTFRRPLESPLETISRRIQIPSRPHRTPHARLSRHRGLPGLRRLSRSHDSLSQRQSCPLHPRQ